MSPTSRPSYRGLLRSLRALRSDPPTGFAERVLGGLGAPPEADSYVRLGGPLGSVYVAFNAEGICHVLATSAVDDDPDLFATAHRERFGRPARRAAKPPAGLARALATGQARTLGFDLRGVTDFEQAVLRKTLEIPRGEVRPYAWVAAEIGRPGAVRAVGSALAHNPVPLLIPCHRVVRTDGRVGGYALGSAIKAQLLALEGVELDLGGRLAQPRSRTGFPDRT